ncbi:protein POLYCHOME-like [Triticum urartu]|uniref:protein POLYCHOME-like n=1 Tax=Triticum urartu TaxID=4572 RepID=UPI002043B917|nr:protein POLYCHOME-like [Triticum urartu]
MPEHRELKRTALTDLSGGGFFIRRVASPGALAGRRAGKPLPRRFASPSSNKENVPPVWAVKATPPRRRSPLPGWYPRTPLRDITVIVKAIERSRLRIAAARQQSETPEQSPQPANLTTPVPAEQGTPHSTEAQDSQAIASGSGLTEMVANPAPGQAEHDFKVYSSPSKSSQKTPTKPIDPALADLMEKKLTSSIEQIEKMVKKNQKKAALPSKRANQRRTLMSMR